MNQPPEFWAIATNEGPKEKRREKGGGGGKRLIFGATSARNIFPIPQILVPRNGGNKREGGRGREGGKGGPTSH